MRMTKAEKQRLKELLAEDTEEEEGEQGEEGAEVSVSVSPSLVVVGS